MIKGNVKITPSLLDKFGIPRSELKLKFPISLGDLDDVTLTSPLNDGDIIQYDITIGEFVNVPGISGTSGVLPNGVFGDTLRYDTSWVATDNLYNDGTNIGINTIIPSERLDVSGSVRVRDTILLNSTTAPIVVSPNDARIYNTSYEFGLYGYSKAVALAAKLETGEEVIISSTLI